MANASYVKSTARDIFLHLLHTIMLIVSVSGLITLLFGYFNVLFPDKLNFYLTDYLDQIRLATSILIVVFPVYILISWILGRDYKKDAEKREIKARRIFMYITLFGAAIALIIDLVVLIYRFYGGDYPIQFLLKILSVLVVAATVFGYYLWDIRRKDFNSKKPKLFGWASSAIIVAIIVTGFFIAGSPATQRDRRFDDTRISDLQNIQNFIAYSFYPAKQRLPLNLDELKNDISGFEVPLDPETKQAYEYRVLNQEKLSFEFCANFETESTVDDIRSQDGPYRATSGSSINWQHGIGKTCFERTIDRDYLKNAVPKSL